MPDAQARIKRQNAHQNTQLDVRAKKAIIRMADTLEDINQKLDHIIKKQANGFWLNGSRLAQ
ncbi:hypothetical protein ACFL6S_07830 [Candidatus Poribacteria bacterium]